MEFYSLEPWGSEIEWYRVGTIAATVTNAAPNRKRSKAASPKDFVPKFGRKKRGDLNPQRLKGEFLSAFGGRIKKVKKDAGTG